jgi:CO/xanthine dehydrogenase FAD-binding subunit
VRTDHSMIDRPRTLDEALDALAANPGADLLAGGTDLMLAVRAGTRRLRHVVALRRVVELRTRGVDGGALLVGAGATYTDLAGWSLAPGLAATARCVGSPQVRNVATVGGALGTASPRGDLLTFLTAAGADVVVASRGDPRLVPLRTFTRAGLRAGELVSAVRLPRPAGPQTYLKVGGRMAAVAGLVSCALVVDVVRRRVRCALGGVGATPVRAEDAEALATEVDWAAGRVDDDVVRAFGAFAARAAAAATDDHAATARYRRHAAGVLASRAFSRCIAGIPRGRTS